MGCHERAKDKHPLLRRAQIFPNFFIKACFETGFYKKIREDLSAAKERVFIFSAFVTPHGLARWLDVFQILLRRGVKIRLVTKPVSDQPKPKTYHGRS